MARQVASDGLALKLTDPRSVAATLYGVARLEVQIRLATTLTD